MRTLRSQAAHMCAMYNQAAILGTIQGRVAAMHNA